MTSGLRLKSFASFGEAEAAWLRFQQGSDHHGVQSYAWLRHWYDTVGHRYVARLLLTEVSDAAGGPLMFLPLGLQRRSGAVRLTWLGGDITDYHAPLLSRDFAGRVPRERFSEIWAAVLDATPRCDVIHFDKQPEYIGPQRNPFLELPGQLAHEINHSCALERDWDALYRRLVKSQLRADSRRKRRRLEEQGTLRFHVAASSAEIGAVARTMIDQKIERYLATRTYNLFNDAAYRTFFAEPSAELVESGMLHVSTLTLNDELLATHWGIVSGGRFYFIMPSFAGGKWEKFSPGRLHIECMFRWCCERGIETFDFTIGDEPFKKIWSNRQHALFRYLKPLTLRGSIYSRIERTKDAVRDRPALHRFVSGLRNRVGR